MIDLNLYNTSSLLASLFAIFISAIAILRDKKSNETLSFAATSLSIGVWTLFPFLTSFDLESTQIVFLGRLAYFAAILSPPPFVWLVASVVPAPPKLLNRLNKFFWGVSLLILTQSFSSRFIADIVRQDGFSKIKYGPIFNLFVIYFIVACSYAFLELARSLRKASGNKKNQLRYILASFFVAFIGGGLHFLSVYTAKEPIPHDFFIIGYTALLAYAIIKHNVMDINLAARYVLIQALFGFAVALPSIFLVQWVKNSFFTVAVIVLIAAFAPTLFGFVRETLTDAVDRLPIFRGRYERFGSLQAHLHQLSMAKSLREWASSIISVSRSLYKSNQIALLVHDEAKRRFMVSSSIGLNDAASIFSFVPAESRLIYHLKRENGPILLENLMHMIGENERKEILSDLMFFPDAAMCLPLMQGGQLHSILILGQKIIGGVFNELEMTSLGSFARAGEHSLSVILSGLAQEQVTSVWAHDLVKPFTLKGSFQYLEEMRQGAFGNVTEEMKTALNLVLGDVQFVRHNLDRLLRPGEPDKYNILPQPLTSVYSRLREKYTIESIKKRITWTVDVPQEGVRVFCDRAMVEHRVISNLVENAFRHTPSEGHIKLGFELRGNEFVGYVQDDGPGIRKDDQIKLFVPRNQLDDKNRGLAGLGLFSAKSVLESQAGRIWVESEFGRGSIFYFKLPLAAAA